MKILVVGSGGREHALIWKLSQSKRVQKVYSAPGNGGIKKLAECIDVKSEDIKSLAEFAKNNKIDLTIVGPELPLVLGITDEFRKLGLKIFGPSREAAKLEGSKVFAKDIMKKYGIPTAKAEVFFGAEQAVSYVNQIGGPVVVKAEGLAAGKGVFVCQSSSEAKDAILKIMQDRVFGDAGNRVIVEECLAGDEVSILAFSDGSNIVPLVSSQDHKRIFDNDAGPNTGGMGAYSPVPTIKEELNWKIQKEILEPVVKGMAKEGIPYTGILYAGLMLTNKGPKVLEFNVRFGDPETQVIMPRLDSDLLDPMLAVVSGDISKTRLVWKKEACVCVVLASGGYPEKYEKGLPVKGLEWADNIENVNVFHAGTIEKDGRYTTNGGRVLGVTALGNDWEDAVNSAYKAVSKIQFENMHYRTDIAKRVLVH